LVAAAQGVLVELQAAVLAALSPDLAAAGPAGEVRAAAARLARGAAGEALRAAVLRAAVLSARTASWAAHRALEVALAAPPAAAWANRAAAP
jgi:hypothetical protein